MALDTAQKRSSVVGHGLPVGVPGWPGAGVDAPDRAQVAGLYSGLDYTPPPEPVVIAGAAPDITPFAHFAGARGEPLARIPLPLGRISGQITWGPDGGVQQVTVGLDADHLQRPFDQQRHAHLLTPLSIPDYAQLQIVIGGEVVAATRVEDVLPAANGLALGCVGLGPSQTWMADRDYLLDDDPSLAPGVEVDGSRLLAAVIDQVGAVVGLRPATGPHWPLTGKLHKTTDADGETPAAVASAVCKRAGFMWTMVGREVRLISPEPPAVPDYLVPFDDSVLVRRVVSNLYSAVRVKFKNPDGSTGRELVSAGPLPLSVLGYQRIKSLTSLSSDRQAAIAAAHEWLRAQGAGVVIGGVKRTGGRGLERWGGGVAQPWSIRPGQWLQVADQLMQQITRVVLNLKTLDVTVSLGPPVPRSMAAVVSTLLSDVVALRSDRDPLTRTPIA